MLQSNDTELIQVRRERDELQALLEKFERHMSEIQANIQVLTGERDKLNNMYEDVSTTGLCKKKFYFNPLEPSGRYRI